MRNKWITAIIFVVCLGMGTVYAAPNTVHPILEWAEDYTEKAKSYLTSILELSLEEQLNIMTQIQEEVKNNSYDQIGHFGLFTKNDTKTSIENQLFIHHENLNKTANHINSESSNDKDEMVNRVNARVDNWMDDIEKNGVEELGELSHVEIDQGFLQQELLISNQNLQQEIEATRLTIAHLKEIQESESNEEIKDFIQKKITFLNNLLYYINIS